MINKYHKEIGFKGDDVIKAKDLIGRLNRRKLSFSKHSLFELNQENNAIEIGKFLLDYTLNFNDVFELVINDGIIEKIGFRVNFNENDVVFMISSDKMIITIWSNKSDDLHFTLNKNNYTSIINH